MILGCDVHAGYDVVRPIDWQACKDAGVEFAIAKCSVGNDPHRDDPSFKRNVAGAKAARITVGAYHFFYGLPSGSKYPAGRSGREQAERAWAKSEGLGANAGEFAPALDLEWPPHYEREKTTGRLVDLWAQWETTPTVIVDGALEYLATMERLSGRVPIVYTYPDYMKNLRDGDALRGIPGSPRAGELARYLLWLAAYPKDLAATRLPPDERWPVAPAPWSKVSLWQFSANGSPATIEGISACPIDRDCILDRETLESLTEKPPTTVDELVSGVGEIVRPQVPLPDLPPPREM